MVVCDGPTEDSTTKFWQMVWDEGCTYLVMLTPQDGDVREHCLCDIMGHFPACSLPPSPSLRSSLPLSLSPFLPFSLSPFLPPLPLPHSQYHCYWPNFGSLRQYGNLIVEVEEESAEHVYTTRKLILTDAKVAVSTLCSLEHAVDTLCSLEHAVDTLCSLEYAVDTPCSSRSCGRHPVQF